MARTTKTKVDVYALYDSGPIEAMDKAARAIMESRGGDAVGAGTFLPTGERDIQYRIPADQVDDAVKALQKAGFRTRVIL